MIKQKENIRPKKAIEFVSNVLNLKKISFPQKIEKKISFIFAKYFLNNSNYFLISKDDDTKKVNGLLTANIKHGNNINLDMKLINKLQKMNNVFINQYLEFQTRITNIININHNPNYEAELILFSSLEKGKGIGSKMIRQFEQDLVTKGINKFCLFTDDNCDYDWYIRHQYRMIGKYQVPVSDLNILFQPGSVYYVYQFAKELINV